MKKTIFLFLLNCLFLIVQSTEYYVNSVAGNDANAGTSINTPWKSLNPVHAKKFLPGDIINFACGSSWTKAGWESVFLIDDSGTAEKPIIFRSYGEGEMPLFSNAGQWNKGIKITADYVIVENLMVKNTGHACINIASGADYNIIRNCEFTNSGIGVHIQGSYNLLTKNYIHNMIMVVNDPKSVNPDNDFGALAFMLDNGHYNEISYNKAIKCRAPSYDYGHDGGFVETWTSAGNNNIHHNWVEDTEGFMEAGGNNPSQLVNDNLIAYNVAYNTTGFTCLHTGGGGFDVTVRNLRIENNTIISTADAYRVIGCIGSSAPGNVFSLKNNIIYSPVNVSDFSNFTHTNNIYYLTGGATVGFPLHNTEKIANPQFIDRAAKDLRLKEGSPAIDTGADLKYSADFEGKTVPSGTAPDIGAYEYQHPTTGSLIFPKNSAGSFNVYHNPSGEFVNLVFNAKQGQQLLFEIFNATGKPVIKQLVTAGNDGANSIQVAMITKPGIYVARLFGESDCEARKIIIL